MVAFNKKGLAETLKTTLVNRSLMGSGCSAVGSWTHKNSKTFRSSSSVSIIRKALSMSAVKETIYSESEEEVKMRC